MQGMSFGQKLSYLWYYFKWPVLLIIVVAIGLGFFIRDWLKAQNENVILSLSLANANSFAVEETELFRNFPVSFGYDEDEIVSVDSGFQVDLVNMDARSAQAFQILAAQFVIGEVDLFICDEALFGRLAQNGGFSSLEEILTPELRSQWSDRLWWYEDQESGELLCCGVRMDGSTLQGNEIFSEEQIVVAGITGRAPHQETAVEMLQYLLP